MHNYILAILLSPLIGFIVNGVWRKNRGHLSVAIIGTLAVAIPFLCALLVFFQLKNGVQPEVVHFYNFIDTSTIKIPLASKVDALSSLFLLIITGIGTLIHIYSSAYMHEENGQHFARFFAYLNLFIFSMLMLVLGSSFVTMFIGWEGVGLCSYLLIGYWFKNIDYTIAAKKAFVMNRIGDLGFLLAIFWIMQKIGSANYDVVFSAASIAKFSAFDITAITMLLFVGAMGKSAQIPLYTWLPDAMAGPTPVSALIHAATMVTAGIYMIARCNVLFSLAETTQTFIAIIGITTALLAATIALKQNDIKKVLAYSTVSQLGYMFLGLGVGAYTGAVFHVMTHAFFKALLFLGAGSVIHAMHHEQDITKMGGLRKYLPKTHLTFLIGSIAIAGIPPFSGFFSKDEILAAAYHKNPIYWVLGVVGAAMTAFYMFRLYTLTFLGNFRGSHEQEHHLHESPTAMTLPLIVLAIFSALGGFFGIPEALGGEHALHHFLASVLTSEKAIHLSHSTEYLLMGLSVSIAAVMILFAVQKHKKTNQFSENTGISKVLENKWYIDELYQIIIVKPLMHIADLFKLIVENKVIDGFVNGTGKFVLYASRQLRLIQNGFVGSYVLGMVLGIIAIVLIWINDNHIIQFLSKIF